MKICVHVIDLAPAYIKAIKLVEKHPNGMYNLGNGQGFSNLEVVKTAEKVTGKKIPFEMISRRPGDPAVLIASSEKACAELRWHKTHPHGFKDAEKSFVENGKKLDWKLA